MSYDLMVFDPEAAPRDREDFMSWYREQTEWIEDHNYDDPAVSGPKLRAWFLDIAEKFPAMNGPYASDDSDDPTVTDYSIGRSVIYSAFAWSQCNDAYQTVFELAKKHELGFFDASGVEGQVWCPDTEGNFACIHASPRQSTLGDETRPRSPDVIKKILKLFGGGG